MKLSQPVAKLSLILLTLCSSACNLPSSEKTADIQSSAVNTEVVDSEVTSRVTTALLNDPQLKELTIEVVTTKGDVALNGFVNDASQSVLAEKIAHDMIGTHAVHNHLEVKK